MNTRIRLVTLGLTLSLSGALAQTTLDLPGAVKLALTSGPDITTARTNQQKAAADLKAKQADPTAVITDLLPARQSSASTALTVQATRLSVTQTVLTQYTALWEAQQSVSLNSAQASLDERQLKIVQAKLQNQAGTQLDVSKAQNTLNQDRQELANAQAQLPVLKAQLAKTLGLPVGTNLNIKAPPAPPAYTTALASLQNGLDARLTGVLSATQAVESAQLQVKLADNDYTARRTLEDARTSLSNAQLDLDSARKSAQTTLRDADRSVRDAQERVRLANQSLTNARTSLAQAQAKLKGGTASTVDVLTAQVNVQSAQLTLTQAQDKLWTALAALGVAGGTDATGLVGR